MKAIIPTLLALVALASTYGRQTLVDLTLYFAREAGEHQHHMMSISGLNHALLKKHHQSTQHRSH
jgi:hypothetical protein